MNKLIPAVFRDGALHPAEPLQIPDGATVRIRVLTPDTPEQDPLSPAEVDAMFRELDAMPDLPSEPPADVAREHDRYLYGDKSEFAHLFRNRRAGDR